MLNKLRRFIKRYDMIRPGDTVIAAVSGGADSVALLFAMYLLKDSLGIALEAAHFNHGLRGEESDRDVEFVRSLCGRYDIPFHLGSGSVRAGEKGLEAAARDARYAYFATLSGKIATAHTADDNAETVLMHLVRGTGLKGLGGIAPVRGNLIRPMLGIQRQEVLEFLEEYHLSFVEDSSNRTDAFLRNRLRHHVMPLLRKENPRLAENLSAMALSLREDETALETLTVTEPDAEVLRGVPAAVRSRSIAAFLKRNGVKEPEAEHIALTEKLIFSNKPSAKADLPGGVTVAREYGKLTVLDNTAPLETMVLPINGTVELPRIGLRVLCSPAEEIVDTPEDFTVIPQGPIVLRCRQEGDALRRSGGTKSLKKRFIDRKIPASRRHLIPVAADEGGILGVYGFGADLDRLGPGVRIRFEKIETENHGRFST